MCIFWADAGPPLLPNPKCIPKNFFFFFQLTNEIIEGHIKLTTLSRPPKSLWSVFQTLDLEVFLLALLSSLALWSLQGLPRQTLEQSIKYISLSLYYFPMEQFVKQQDFFTCEYVIDYVACVSNTIPAWQKSSWQNCKVFFFFKFFNNWNIFACSTYVLQLLFRALANPEFPHTLWSW